MSNKQKAVPSKSVKPQNNRSKAQSSAKPAPQLSNAQLAAQQEAKREIRQQRQLANQEAARQRKRAANIRRATIWGGVLAAVLVLGVFFYVTKPDEPGEHVAMQPSQPHLAAVTDSHPPYTTDPPTSGQHVQTVPNWGVYATPIAKESQVHGLEDGGVVINYQPDLAKDTVTKLTALVQNYDKQVILSPYPGLSDPIVLTAWTRIERLKAYDEPAIQRFIKAYRGIDHHNESNS